ncbi:hypothetical protein D3C85_1061680 [compost metagenome]
MGSGDHFEFFLYFFDYLAEVDCFEIDADFTRFQTRNIQKSINQLTHFADLDVGLRKRIDCEIIRIDFCFMVKDLDISLKRS